MPTLDLSLLVAECARQPELFGPAAVFAADDAEVIRSARTGRYSGRIATRHEARCKQVVLLRLQGHSLRSIERETGMDPRLVSRVVEEVEARGELPALKERLSRRLAELGEATADLLGRELAKDNPDAGDVKNLWIGLGIAADKQTAAGPDQVHLHQHLHVERSARDAVAEYAQMLRSEVAPDSKSGDGSCAPAPCIDCPPVDTADVTAEPEDSGRLDAPRLPADPAARDAREGGGGGLDAAPGAG